MHFATRVRTWRVARLYNVQCTVQWNSSVSETVWNRTHVHIRYFCLEWSILWPPRMLTFPSRTLCIGVPQYYKLSRDSSVGTATRLQVERPRNRYSISDRKETIFFSSAAPRPDWNAPSFRFLLCVMLNDAWSFENIQRQMVRQMITNWMDRWMDRQIDR
jgi:hypothetical protein